MVVQLAQQVLVVPPFECAWLTGENYLLRNGKGCISFEVKGDNDVTVILKPQCGSRRWQHLTSGRLSPVESNYTIILGSHRNSCLKIEKDGELCHMASGVPGAKLSATSFTKYWVDYNGNTITIGAGEPAPAGACCRWTDAHPIIDVRFVGLSAWDKHVGYRNIRVQPTVSSSPQSGDGADVNTGHPASAHGPQSTLADLCCRRLMDDISPSLACAVLAVTNAIAPEANTLRERAIEFVARHFCAVLHEDTAEFLSLDPGTLAEIVQSQSLACGEKIVFDGLMLWADGKPLECIEALLPYVRFPQMSNEELRDVSTHPLASHSSLLRELVQEAIDATGLGRVSVAASVVADRWIREPTPSEAAAKARFQRRNIQCGGIELMYMYDGDQNGVCWHLGTHFGTQAWLNPALLGLIEVRASSPVARGTDPRALVGRTFMRTNFAGPRREPDGSLSAWWQLDLGPHHRLACTYYTLRHDGSTDFLRNWSFQASRDGVTWHDLRVHKWDATFKLPGQYASWPISGAAAAVPYRYFRARFLAVDEASRKAHAQRVCLSNIELYGTFYRDQKSET